MTKRCSSCGETKPQEEFARRASSNDGLQAYCRPCGRRRSREWYARNIESERERSRERMRRLTQENPELVRQRNREWARRNPDKIRASNLRRYNLTPEQYEDMLVRQGGVCASCSAPEPGGQGSWHIDHDHSCCDGPKRSCGGCVRGLLCSRCNTVLGMVNDNKETLLSLVDYLDRNAVRR